MMAAVSGPAATYTPPSSSHGRYAEQSGDWHFSVPVTGVRTLHQPASRWPPDAPPDPC